MKTKEILRTPSYSGKGFSVVVALDGPLARLMLVDPTGWRHMSIGLDARMARQVQTALVEALAALEGRQ
jgi:hypothetical protein